MKLEELLQVYAFAETLWNTFKPQTDEFKTKIQNQLWYDLLKPYELKIIQTAMVEQSKISDFCNLGKLAKECENIQELANNEVIDEDNIFHEIDRAITALNKEEAFNSLSPIAKEVVCHPSQLNRWGMSEISDFDTVLASNIKRAIRNKSAMFKKIKSLNANGIEIEYKEIKRIGD